MTQEAAPHRGPFPWHPWDFVLAAVGAVAAAVLILVAALVAVPPMATNLSSEVSDGATAVPIGDGVASVVVPEGWVVQRDGAAVIARTPDGGMTVRLGAAEGDAAEELRRLLDSADGASGVDVGAIRAETLASGLQAVHADVDGGVYAVVDVGGGDLVTVVATSDGDYRAALGQLLEGVRS